MKLANLKPRLSALNVAKVQTMAADSWRTSAMNSAQRGYGYRWQQARADFLKRRPLCSYCERDGHVTAATVVDHKVPHRGDIALFWDRGNWQPLCKTHHDGEKRREEGVGRVESSAGLRG